MSYKMIDLFAGVGGLSLGFENCGFEVVLANEYDPSIAEAYVKNRNNPAMIVHDITKLPIEETFGPLHGKIDLIVGGPPCQGFSQKGQRKTINDPRNFLFKYFVDVVEKVEPTYFVMENVPNLLTAENGYFKNEIINLFSELGYVVSAEVLCAADFGVPQNRRRAFIIGKKTTGDPVHFPEKVSHRTTIWDAISDLAYLESGQGEEVQDYQFDAKSEYQALLRSNSNKLYNHVATNHSATAIARLKMIPPKGGKEFLPEEHLTKSIYSGTWCRMDADDISVTRYGKRQQSYTFFLQALVNCSERYHESLYSVFTGQQLGAQGHDTPPDTVEPGVCCILRHVDSGQLKRIWVHDDTIKIPVRGSHLQGTITFRLIHKLPFFC